MILYRIAQRKFITNLDGMGSFLHGGRWTSKGIFAIYTAESKSLSYLEYLAHQFGKETWPSALAISTLRIERNQHLIQDVKAEDLPDNWQNLEYRSLTQRIGDQLIIEGGFGLKVPSAIVDGEYNVLLNPRHTSFNSSVKQELVKDLKLDQRFGFR